MNRITWLAIAALVVAFSPSVQANEWKNDRKEDWKCMVKSMDLTADQQQKLKAIGEEQRKEMQPLTDQLTTKLKELSGLVDGNATDDQISAKLNDLKQTREAMQAARKKYADQKEQVLTPKQRAKTALQMEKMWKERKGGKERDRKKCESGEKKPATNDSK